MVNQDGRQTHDVPIEFNFQRKYWKIDFFNCFKIDGLFFFLFCFTEKNFCFLPVSFFFVQMETVNTYSSLVSIYRNLNFVLSISRKRFFCVIFLYSLNSFISQWKNFLIRWSFIFYLKINLKKRGTIES